MGILSQLIIGKKTGNKKHMRNSRICEIDCDSFFNADINNYKIYEMNNKK